MQPPLRVEHVGEAEQVVLVGAAAVVQDEQAGGVAGRRALAEGQLAHFGVSSWSGPPLCQSGWVSDGQLIVAGGLLAAGWLASLLSALRAVPRPRGGDRLRRDRLIHFEDYELARFVGVATAAVILFEAGLAGGFAETSGPCCSQLARRPRHVQDL